MNQMFSKLDLFTKIYCLLLACVCACVRVCVCFLLYKCVRLPMYLGTYLCVSVFVGVATFLRRLFLYYEILRTERFQTIQLVVD